MTNYSVNKNSKMFVRGDEESGRGSKWSHSYYRRFLADSGYDVRAIFSSIKDVIIKTCIAAEPNMLDISTKTLERRSCCF